MNDPRDEDLRDAIASAVTDVEPADRLAAIRRRTTLRTARHTTRRWYAVGGTALVSAAAIITVVAVLAQRDTSPHVADPVGPAASADPGVAGPAVPVYYVGHGPDGPDAPAQTLYRYFEHGGSPLELLMRSPSDPDYRTLWPAGSLTSYDVQGGEIRVLVSSGAVGDRLAQQQLVYTLQAEVGRRLPVRLVTASGVAQPGPIEAAPALTVLNEMSISDPAEGTSFSGSFIARGVSNGFEASVSCRLLDAGGASVWEAPTTAAGYMEPRLFPWRLQVDLSAVRPGVYTLSCTTDDASGGAGGYGAATDTRSITVE